MARQLQWLAPQGRLLVGATSPTSPATGKSICARSAQPQTNKTMKYLVTIRRKEYREHVFEIDGATSRGEAESEALNMSCDHDFSENTVCHADEEVVYISESSNDGASDTPKNL